MIYLNIFFFFNDTATTEIYTLSLHDALPIFKRGGKVWISIYPDRPLTKKPAETRMGSGKGSPEWWVANVKPGRIMFELSGDRKSTRLNSSHANISYAVFCLKKKKTQFTPMYR